MRWVAIGGFDGVHLGHQRLIGRANLVLIIEKGGGLTPSRERCRYIPVPCYFLELEGIKGWSVREFLEFLKGEFGGIGVVVGEDFRFGANREGDWRILGEWFPLEVIPEVKVGGVPVHSRVIRRLLREGRIEEGNRLLGRGYQIWGVVEEGQGIGGKVLGVPTLNLRLKLPFLLPKEGVYFGRVAGFPAIAFLGTRSTDFQFTIEVHLLHWRGEFPIAGERVEFQFLHYHRSPIQFGELEGLKKQIWTDLTTARHYFSGELE
ncbi:MAG: riboflavin kinase [Campylobacterales bacterium]